MRRRAITALVAAASLSVVTACSSGEPETAAEPPTSASTSASPSASSSSSSAQGRDVVADPPSRTWEDAVEVDGTITTWKAEGKDTGKVIYEFDILSKGSAANADDTEVQVDAVDGSIVKDS